MTQSHNDQPIEAPEEDRFGIDPFAQSISRAIRGLQAPQGSVIAINGVWGSGKSSAANLVIHHLKGEIEAQRLILIRFACWWFRGEEALALAFFRELYAGLNPSLGDKLKKVLPKLGARLLRAGGTVGSAIDLIGAPGVGTVVGGTMEWLGGLIEQDQGVEELHSELSRLLRDQGRRFLIVIDDIDRLSPEEALLIFRLVKSVGRLPNVIYLLIYDRILAERVVSRRFPSEGPKYLEKIVQASFDLPEPRHSDLCNQLLVQIEAICGSPKEDSVVDFMNLFYECVAPEIQTPRDLLRIGNLLSVVWPSVDGDVNLGDFVVSEALRLFRPELHRAIRTNKDRLCSIDDHSLQRLDQIAAQYDAALLSGVSKADIQHCRNVLMRLFPLLEGIWGNMHYGPEWKGTWARDRRICSSAHFEAYFRFSVGESALSSREIDELIDHACDSDFLTGALRQGLNTKRADGTTKASLILSELTLHADRVPKDCVPSLLTVVFGLADELNVPEDEAKAFSIGSNFLRIHWLLRALTRDRMETEERSSVLIRACERSSLGWLVDFAISAHSERHPREGREPTPDEKCLLTLADEEKLRLRTLSRIRAAATTGVLQDNSGLSTILWHWSYFAQDSDSEVKSWTDAQLDSKHGVVSLARAFTSHSWSQGFGDRVAKRNIRASTSNLDSILNKQRFRARLEEFEHSTDLDEASQHTIRAFLDAWRRQESDPRRYD